MDVNFKHTDPAAVEPIRIEQVFAEKPGGGLVENPTFDAPATTAVGEKDGKFALIKAYRLVAAVAAGDTTISIAKGSGVAVGDIIATGKKGVACTKVDTSAEDKDVVTVTLGVEVENGKVKNVQFFGGCNGNLKGISALVEGMDIDECITRVEGIKCGMKATSCPDQLAQALKAAKEQA